MTHSATPGAIELLADTPTVRAWRVGSDYQIECYDGYTDDDFDTVIDQLGLTGRTNYEWSYIPEAGMEIIHMPMLQTDRGRVSERTLSMGVGTITAGLMADATLVWGLTGIFF